MTSEAQRQFNQEDNLYSHLCTLSLSRHFCFNYVLPQFQPANHLAAVGLKSLLSGTANCHFSAMSLLHLITSTFVVSSIQVELVKVNFNLDFFYIAKPSFYVVLNVYQALFMGLADKN